MIHLDWPAGFAGIPFALVAGFFGATFFILAQLRTRLGAGTLEDITAFYAWRNLVVRCLFGSGGALILYFFFQTGLLQGSLWPNLTKLGFDSCCGGSVPNQHLSLLLVWSFIVGYSESFVPSVLLQTEARATSANE
jgi:hypothetical protein